MDQPRIKTAVVRTTNDELNTFLGKNNARLVDIHLYAQTYVIRYAEVGREYVYKIDWHYGGVTFNVEGSQPRIERLYEKGALNVWVCVFLNSNGSYANAIISEWEDWKHRSEAGE